MWSVRSGNFFFDFFCDGRNIFSCNFSDKNERPVNREQEQMFFTLPASEMKPNSEYEFELTSVRRGRSGPVFGRKNFLTVQTDEAQRTKEKVTTTKRTTTQTTHKTTVFYTTE